MRHRSVSMVFALGLLAFSPFGGEGVMAQEAQRDTSNPAVEVGREILRVLRLPQVADSIRDAGVPAAEVEEVFRSARAERIPAIETAEVLEESMGAIREHGPMENFGPFVQSQLASGLRGRDLAAAIRAEHARSGIGKGRKLRPAQGDTAPGAERGRRGEQVEKGGRGKGQGNGTGR